ncbi:hypothetical protein B0H66DRAFT_528620 [Apodospora peruviana]|uniref:F-box domain-containing protein n=1 Tax=Apodospora peruviana TaxID=516989 RepID=A0AAE0IUA5_9PEZI|nr:hypothetical protein B0H66DRAFT_528620 [Apodospora peruviana]
MASELLPERIEVAGVRRRLKWNYEGLNLMNQLVQNVDITEESFMPDSESGTPAPDPDAHEHMSLPPAGSYNHYNQAPLAVLISLCQQVDMHSREESLAILDAIWGKLRDYRVYFQREIDSLLHQFPQRLTILDLPDETLLNIFEMMKGFDIAVRMARTNCRLTCHRFCSFSSSLLVRFVPVMPLESSLSRLVVISQHPTISKGVVAVRVVLYCYSPVLSDTYEEFQEYLLHVLSSMLVNARGERDWFGHGNGTVHPEFAEAQALLDSLLRVSPHTLPGTYPPSEEDLLNLSRMKTAYEEYRRLYFEQDKLRSSDKFVQTIADAMARMPRARQLEVDDRDDYGG